MNFDIVVDTELALAISATATLPKTNPRKKILGLVNDFEDTKWRYTRFLDFIWNNIAQTSLSARERASLSDNSMTALRRSALNLRLTDSPGDPGKGSEIAEILLYAVMKHHFNALPVVPKIFYKQNNNDNAKGADSVHIVIADNGQNFTLWLGESKFYSDIGNARLDRVITSISDLLSTEKIKKENSIITGLSDLDDLINDKAICAKIRGLLDDDRSIDKIKPMLHVPILLLHECSITASAVDLDDEYTDSIRTFYQERASVYFDKQATKLGNIPHYKKITFHLIVFPVPSKSEIVKRFVSVANALKAD